MAMVLGNDKIGCHTYCRFDDPSCTWDNAWDLGRGTHLWTFLHPIVRPRNSGVPSPVD
jgi:hypothetical protein